MRRLKKGFLKLSLLGKFSAITFLLMAAIATALALGIQRHLEEDALRQEAENAANTVDKILKSHMRKVDFPEPLDQAKYAELDNLIRQYILGNHIVRVKIWNRDGMIVYSDRRELVGYRFPTDEGLKEALEGKISMEISDLRKEENSSERELSSRLMEIYVPLQPADSTRIEGAYEIYHHLSVLDPHLSRMRRFVWGSVGFGFFLLYGSLFTLVRRASRELVRRSEENEKLYEEVKQQLAERKKSEEALRKSEEKLRELYDNAPVGYREYDTEGRLCNINRTELEMTGHSFEEMIGQPAWKFVVGEEKARETILAKLAGNIPPSQGLERVIRRKDGTTFPVLIRDRILRDGYGRITGMRSTIQDITDRKQAEDEKAALQEQLRQSQKIEAIGQLAGGIAHDFNNLLTIIKGYSQISLFELQEDGPLRGNMAEIEKAANRAADLTRQLLAFSRRQILEMKVLDLNMRLRDLDKMLRRIIGEDIELVTLPGSDLGRIKADPGQIEQVVLNLAVNARDAMPTGGKLTLETANVELDEAYALAHVAVTPGHYVMLSVSDTGVGMTPEVRNHIFEPFFTTKETGKGTGLGLAMVYGIVKQSGGNIWVYSEPGKGTTFKIYLLRVDEPLERISDKTGGKELPHGRETILIVEDEEEVRKLALLILEKQGYRILSARSGEDALSVCKEHPESIHLLLTDVVMPGMSGHALAEHLVSFRPEAKVLYMSGYTDNAIVHHGILEPGTNYIQKPFTVEGLITKVREVLDQ